MYMTRAMGVTTRCQAHVQAESKAEAQWFAKMRGLLHMSVVYSDSDSDIDRAAGNHSTAKESQRSGNVTKLAARD